MAVDERRRFELFERLTATLGQEAATTLSELLPPRGGEIATAGDLAHTEVRLTARMDGLEHRLDGVEHRLEAMEHRLTGLFERRISEAVTAQTRTLVLSQLAALVAIAALAFGLR
jgi:hypothetical protein